MSLCKLAWFDFLLSGVLTLCKPFGLRLAFGLKDILGEALGETPGENSDINVILFFVRLSIGFDFPMTLFRSTVEIRCGVAAVGSAGFLVCLFLPSFAFPAACSPSFEDKLFLKVNFSLGSFSSKVTDELFLTTGIPPLVLSWAK